MEFQPWPGRASKSASSQADKTIFLLIRATNRSIYQVADKSSSGGMEMCVESSGCQASVISRPEGEKKKAISLKAELPLRATGRRLLNRAAQQAAYATGAFSRSPDALGQLSAPCTGGRCCSSIELTCRRKQSISARAGRRKLRGVSMAGMDLSRQNLIIIRVVLLVRMSCTRDGDVQLDYLVSLSRYSRETTC